MAQSHLGRFPKLHKIGKVVQNCPRCVTYAIHKVHKVGESYKKKLCNLFLAHTRAHSEKKFHESAMAVKSYKACKKLCKVAQSIRINCKKAQNFKYIVAQSSLIPEVFYIVIDIERFEMLLFMLLRKVTLSMKRNTVSIL